MKFKDFINMYDNLNGIIVVNDNTLETIVKDVAWKVVEGRTDLYEKEVISFGFYDGELTVRIRD